MERFVVGSGRCGSTLLGSMLAKHECAMVLSEFYATLDRTECFSDANVAGAYFAEFLARSNAIADITMRRGRGADEILFEKEASGALPGPLLACLPMLTSAPADLFREMLEAVGRFPSQTFAAHYRQLFKWLLEKLGKSLWIERSGPSIEYLSDLIEMFPDALYVHLHRDGPEVALSMHRHSYFQLVTSFFVDPPSESEVRQTEYGGNPVTDSDPFSRRLSTELPAVDSFGRYWSYQQAMGFRALARLKPTQVLQIAFEDLVSSPRRVLTLIAEFFQLPGGSSRWLDDAVRLIHGVPPHRAGALSTQDKIALTNACECGQILLGRQGSAWIKPTLELLKTVRREAR